MNKKEENADANLSTIIFGMIIFSKIIMEVKMNSNGKVSKRKSVLITSTYSSQIASCSSHNLLKVLHGGASTCFLELQQYGLSQTQ